MTKAASLVEERSTTIGTGDLTVSPVQNRRDFATALGTGIGNKFYYHITHTSNAVNEWEFGIGYMSDAVTLVRDTVIQSSAGVATLEAFTIGTKNVVCDIVGELQVAGVNGKTGVVVLDPDDLDDTATTNKFMTASEQSKLAGIDPGATDDQTGAEIKVAYEGEADTNAFTDAEKSKLTGIEPLATADQTDAEIETAYNNEVPIVSQPVAEAGTSTLVFRWTPERVAQAIAALESGAPVSSVNTQTGAVVLDPDDLDDTVTTNKFTDAADIAKLAGIEPLATADQTDSEIEIAYNNQVDVVSQVEAEAGVSTVVRRWTAQRVAQAIAALETGGTAPVDSVNGQTGVVVLDADDIADAVTTNKFTTAGDISKLAGIEPNATADQTGAEIKIAYEAELNTNAFTDAEQSKLAGIDPGAEVNAVDSVNTQTGAVVLDADDIDDTVTTNKFTTAGDISKLAGIEPNATADQTGAEIKLAYEAELNTNAFTDAEQSKLIGIEAGAEVNTVDSVNAQTGAVVLDPDDLNDTTTINKFTTAGDISKLAGIEPGAEVNTVDSVNGLVGIVVLDPDDLNDAATANKFTTAAEISKLAGIEPLATADQTDLEIETAYNNQVAVVSQVDAEAGTSTTVYRWTPERVSQAIQASSVASIFTKEYISGDQVITPAGALTLAHGLGEEPKQVHIELVNTVAEHGYTIGDVVGIHDIQSGANNQGIVETSDATNLNIRYGAGTGGGNPVFTILNKLTGASTNITNANWQVRFTAYA